MAVLNNIQHQQALLLKDQVAYAEGQVVSKTLVQNKGLGITLFAFAKGEGISTHDDKTYALKAGESIVMPARHPHSVYAAKDTPFKMFLVVAFPEA